VLSHELARALLARRDNDVRIVVIASDGGTDDLEISVPLRDSADEMETHRVTSDQVVHYFPTADEVAIFAGEVYTGPRRDDAVAAWLKRRRDEQPDKDSGSWRVIDDLLDEYREHAETGTPLTGPHPEGA
jgi:hypothetical protein